ncbi:MAG: tRNA (adenosine(37)-N6)-threonylcarbamoyltransferase complex dimerization subunit type 1 TsaB [Treponema sp.]|jgi:tRNA threonylcarbamoyladenosine biosynthesis protein TsaB|nr:tRNA (adenosine(37)-N6)-threonylcarbamoyltransferase complex dimerization subunit type 1 TsaB [Treponema sp.]
MKALAVDTSINKISLAAWNEDTHTSLIIQAELKQSEKIVPAIEYVLEQSKLDVNDIEFLAVALGPGTFTGLRLGFSAIKAISLATGAPIYGIPTLDAYQAAFSEYRGTFVPVIDAKKGRFYISVWRNGIKCIEDTDISPEDALKTFDPEEELLLVGNDAPLFRDKLLEIRPLQKCFVFDSSICIADQLIIMAEHLFRTNAEPLKDYDGPTYIRKSEAEENSKILKL